MVPASVIVCSRNRPHFLETAVTSILAGHTLPEEIVIVDQSDAPHARLSRLRQHGGCRVRYLWERTPGLSRANNTAAAAASSEVLVFTHDDVVATPTWLSALVDAVIAGGPRTVATGRVLATAAEHAGGFAPSTLDGETPFVAEGRAGGDILHPMNMAMHRTALRAAGGFDERIGPGTPFPGGEDHDLEFRLRDTGHRIAYTPDAVLYHRAWRRADEYLPIRWRYGLGQGAFYAKHLSLHDRWMLTRLRWDVAHRGLRFLRRLPRHPRLAAGDLLFLAGVFLGGARWRLAHHRV